MKTFEEFLTEENKLTALFKTTDVPSWDEFRAAGGRGVPRISIKGVDALTASKSLKYLSKWNKERTWDANPAENRLSQKNQKLFYEWFTHNNGAKWR